MFVCCFMNLYYPERDAGIQMFLCHHQRGHSSKEKKNNQHGEIKEEGSFNPCLSKKSITPPHMAPTQSLIFEKNSVESPIKLMTDRRGWSGGGYRRGKWFFWIVKINKHVWAYSVQQETPQWESFLAESQQEMKDNLTLNTCVGTYHLSFPIMGGQSCYQLIAEVELNLSFSF